MSQFAESWDEARRRYADITGLDPNGSQFPHPSSVDDLLVTLDTQNKNFTEFRSRKGKFYKILFEVSKPIGIIVRIAGSSADGVFPAATVCLGALTHLIDAAKGVSSTYDTILELLETLTTFLERMNRYENVTIPESLKNHFTKVLVVLLQVFAYSIKTIKTGTRDRIKRLVQNAVRGSDEVVPQLVTKLDKLSKDEGLIKATETLLNTQKLIEGQEKTDQDLQGIKKALDGISSAAHIQSSSEKHLENAKMIIKPSISTDDIFQTMKNKLVDGTGAWVRDQQVFKDWLEERSTTLCITGSPGFGKSFIAASIILHLQKEILQDTQGSDGSVAFFFFRDNNPETRKIDQCLRDLTYQIYRNDLAFQAYFNSHFSSEKDLESPESIWREIFQAYFLQHEEAKKVYLVLDGLDEAFEEDQQTLFSILGPDMALAGASPKIQIILTGRQHVINELGIVTNETFPTIHVDRFKNRQDISQYINLSIKRSRALDRLRDSKLKKEIAETLLVKSQGMFLWVDLMIRELSNKSRSSKIREALQAAPQGLNGMVQTVLNNYSLMFEDEDEAGDFNLILVWIVCAARPLYLAEIDQILNLRLSDEDKITGLEERLRFEWGILLDVNRTDGLTTGDLEGDPNRLYKAMDIFKIEDENSQEFREETEIETEFASDPKTTKVTFCHASIGDIFKYGSQGQGQVSAGDGHPLIGINMADATMQTLKSCLELIHSSDQKNGFLRGYAISNWFDHLKQAAKYAGDAKVDTQLRETCATLILNLFESEKILKEWLPDFSARNFNTENLNCLLVFVKECTTVDSIPSESRDWAKSIIARPIELFLPAAQLAAKQWLQGISWNTKLCTGIIYRVSSLQNGDLADDTPEVLPADVVLEAAERTGLEKNSEWHRRLAKSLRDLKYVEESQQHFETAIALDDQNWLAFAGLGRAKNLKGNIEEAQKLYKSSAEVLESLVAADENDHELKTHLARSYEDIGETAYHLKDMTTAQIYFKKSMELSKDRFVAITNYLAVIPEDDTEEIIRVMKSLDVENPNSPGFTYLSALLYTREAFAGISVVYFKVASAFKSTGEIEWLQNAYRAAILSARHYQNFVMEFRLNLKIADLLSVYSEEEEKALQIWKAVLNFPATFLRSNTILKYEHNYVGKLYASHLLKRAFLSGTPEAKKCIKELEDIAVAPDVLEREAPGWEWYILPMPSLILGVWKKFAGEHDEADALLRPYLRFTTSDIFNEDINGRVATDYITAKILIATGDEARATSLLQIFRGSELFYFQCYARCGAAHTHWTGAYSCKVCLADLCDGCTEVLKSGKKLPINICGPDHSWVYIEGLETPPEKGKILYNGETIPIAQFYRGLRADWKVE